MSWLISLLVKGLLRVQEAFLFHSSFLGRKACPDFFSPPPFVLVGYVEIFLALVGV